MWLLRGEEKRRGDKSWKTVAEESACRTGGEQSRTTGQRSRGGRRAVSPYGSNAASQTPSGGTERPV